jgi:hypothetical protein
MKIEDLALSFHGSKEKICQVDPAFLAELG